MLPRVSWFHWWWNNPSLLMPGVSVTTTLILHYLSLTHKLFWCCLWVEPRVLFWVFFSLYQMKPPQICSFGSKAAFGTIRSDFFFCCCCCCGPSSQAPNIGFTVPGHFVIGSFRETPVSERYKDDEWERRELLILAAERQLLHKLEVCICQNGGLTQSVLLQPFKRLGALHLSSQMSDFVLFFPQNLSRGNLKFFNKLALNLKLFDSGLVGDDKRMSQCVFVITWPFLKYSRVHMQLSNLYFLFLLHVSVLQYHQTPQWRALRAQLLLLFLFFQRRNKARC